MHMYFHVHACTWRVHNHFRIKAGQENMYAGTTETESDSGKTYMYMYNALYIYTGLEINSLPNGQVALICLARAGMYSVAFMHYWLPDLQYYLPRACGQALNASPDTCL